MSWTLVTGGAKGLGKEMALALAEQGHSIILHYCADAQGAEEGAELCRARGVEAEVIAGDFGTAESLDRFNEELLNRFPDISHLINNAGPYLVKACTETSPEEWKALFQLNLHAPIALMQALLPSIKSGQGSILNIGAAGLEGARGSSYAPAYRAAKLSLLMLTRSFAKELAAERVRVNMISPGQLETSSDLDYFRGRLPMGRPVKCREAAELAAFLMRQDSITGQNIEVAGGFGL